MEQAINTEFLPFTGRLQTIGGKANHSLPTEVQRKISQLEHLCVIGPQQLREGIKGYEQLRFDMVVSKIDGRSADQNSRAAIVTGLRQLL